MNEVLLLILNYLPPVVSVGAVAYIGKIIIKVVVKKLSDVTDLKNKLSFICKKLQDEHDEKEELKKEITALRMEMKGFRNNEEKVSKN